MTLIAYILHSNVSDLLAAVTNVQYMLLKYNICRGNIIHNYDIQ